MEPHALSLQSAKLTQPRNYNDKRYKILLRHPKDAPEWTFVIQETPADTDFDKPMDTPPVQDPEEPLTAKSRSGTQ